MSTFTKEQLIEKLQHRISVASEFPESEKAQMDLELARIALESLEAEAVCVIDQSNLDYLKSGSDADVWPASRAEMGDVLLYRSATPAPVTINAEPVAWLWSHRKHPSEVTLVRPEDDERAEGAHWSGWSCQSLYTAPPAPVSVPAAMEMDDDFDSAFEHGKAVGWNAYRAAMLQGANDSLTHEGKNHPEDKLGMTNIIPRYPVGTLVKLFPDGVATGTVMYVIMDEPPRYHVQWDDGTHSYPAQRDLKRVGTLYDGLD